MASVIQVRELELSEMDARGADEGLLRHLLEQRVMTLTYFRKVVRDLLCEDVPLALAKHLSVVNRLTTHHGSQLRYLKVSYDLEQQVIRGACTLPVVIRVDQPMKTKLVCTTFAVNRDRIATKLSTKDDTFGSNTLDLIQAVELLQHSIPMPHSYD